MSEFDDWVILQTDCITYESAFNAGRKLQRENAALIVFKYFESLRFDECHHLGLGDVRVTIGQIEELVKAIREQEITDD